MNISAAITWNYAYIRARRFEVHVERVCEVTRPVAGEVVCYVGRWALHLVNHRRVQAGFGM
ncbi:hypothetical protein SAMN04488005_0451 [Yoonia tamlensis]|uniref:Uncharacterized protein n=1 Tax=Yoonia tamlensis TaxID=390270 RepID=A0A1I6FTF6_9RHOB|nr:hypothetical protein SAMN04488005_0451 [Yoonia tamlensis]